MNISSHTFAPALLASVLALSAGTAYADARIVLSLAGEAFDGPPAFELRMGDKVIGSDTAAGAIDTETDGRLFTNADPLCFVEQFEFMVPDRVFEAKAPISVSLTNDKFRDEDRGFDRNIFIEYLDVNGVRTRGTSMALTDAGKPYEVDFQVGLLPIYSNSHRATALPPVDGWPEGDAAPMGPEAGSAAAYCPPID